MVVYCYYLRPLSKLPIIDTRYSIAGSYIWWGCPTTLFGVHHVFPNSLTGIAHDFWITGNRVGNAINFPVLQSLASAGSATWLPITWIPLKLTPAPLSLKLISELVMCLLKSVASLSFNCRFLQQRAIFPFYQFVELIVPTSGGFLSSASTATRWTGPPTASNPHKSCRRFHKRFVYGIFRVRGQKNSFQCLCCWRNNLLSR